MNVQEGGGGLQLTTPLHSPAIAAAEHQPLVLVQVPSQGTKVSQIDALEWAVARGVRLGSGGRRARNLQQLISIRMARSRERRLFLLTRMAVHKGRCGGCATLGHHEP